MNDIDIIELREAGWDGGELMGYYCKGHPDPYEFCQAANKYSGASESYDPRFCKPEDTYHVWWRCIPMPDQPGEMRFETAVPRSRGSFPATVCESVWGITRRRIQREISDQNRARATGMAEGVNWVLQQMDIVTSDVATKIINRWRDQP